MLEQIKEDFELFDDLDDRYQYLIDLGKELVDAPDELKTDDALVKGCQSKVWLWHKENDGRYFFNADSDAFIVRGLVSIILKVYSGKTTEEINEINADDILNIIGLGNHLTTGRQNGVRAMIEKIQKIANGS